MMIKNNQGQADHKAFFGNDVFFLLTIDLYLAKINRRPFDFISHAITMVHKINNFLQKAFIYMDDKCHILDIVE